MKISKRQLKRIIKEEKAKLLSETTPRINAEYQQGNYADVNLVSSVESAVEALHNQIGNDDQLMRDYGDDDEVNYTTVNIVTLTLADACERLGMIAQKLALESTLD